jgi:hypothetical protein
MSQALSESQQDTIFAIADAFIPSLSEQELQSVTERVRQNVTNPPWPEIEAFLRQSCIDSPGFREALKEFLNGIPPKAFTDLAGFLDLLQ